MEEFVRIALSFPPVLFSLMLVVVVIYWIFMVLGFLDLDLFDFDVDLDVDLDLDVDIAAKGLIDGAAKGLIDGAAATSADGLHGIFASIFSALSIGRVPVTISFSIFTLAAWAMSFAGVHYLENALGEPLGWLPQTGLLVATFFTSLIVAGTAVKPLRGLFATHTRRGQDTLIGKLVRVSTGRVDSKFGQATLEDGGAGLILSIRCDDADNNLQRGQKALIVGYDEPSNIYFVEPYDNFLHQKNSDLDTAFDFDVPNPNPVLSTKNLASSHLTSAEATTAATHNASGEKQ